MVVSDPIVFEGCADIFCNKDCHLKFLQSTFAGIELFLKAIKEQVRNEDDISSNIFCYFYSLHLVTLLQGMVHFMVIIWQSM